MNDCTCSSPCRRGQAKQRLTLFADIAARVPKDTTAFANVTRQLNLETYKVTHFKCKCHPEGGAQ